MEKYQLSCLQSIDTNFKTLPIGKDRKFSIIKIDDGVYSRVQEMIQSISTDPALILWLMSTNIKLSEFYFVLSQWFGKSSLMLDSSKQTFRFPFLVLVKNKFLYLFDVYDMHGGISYKFYKVFECSDTKIKNSLKTELIEKEISTNEISEFLFHFFRFVEVISTFCRENCHRYTIEPFYKTNYNERIIHGYIDSSFFEVQLKTEKKFRAYISKLDNKIKAANHVDETEGNDQEFYRQLFHLIVKSSN